jgi:hypothetical protein
MTTNLYFSQSVRSEQSLYEDIIIESLKIYGNDVYYLPRELVNEDTIFSEDVPSKFPSSYKIEMYIENVEGFDGEGDLFTKFGIQIRDQATFVVSRKRWKHVVGHVNNSINSERPREGDLIYLPLSKSLFQIMFVEHEQPFYQLSNIATFKLRCELFEYNDEKINTGIEDIDRIEKLGYTVTLLLDSYGDSSGIPDLVSGDEVYQLFGTNKLIGEVLNYNMDTREVVVAHIGMDNGEFKQFTIGGDLIKDRTSVLLGPNQIVFDTVRKILAIRESPGGDTSYSQNDDFDTEKNSLVLDFLDFSEKNPFGDPEDV